MKENSARILKTFDSDCVSIFHCVNKTPHHFVENYLIFLFQSDKPESLRSSDAGYQGFARQIPKFHSLSLLSFNIDRVSSIENIFETLKQKHAIYHKSCYDKLNDTKLKRLET